MVTGIREIDGFSRTLGVVKTLYEEHHYDCQKLTHLQRQFLHVTYDVNVVENIIGNRSM